MVLPYRRLIIELSVLFKPVEENSPPSVVEALSGPRIVQLKVLTCTWRNDVKFFRFYLYSYDDLENIANKLPLNL